MQRTVPIKVKVGENVVELASMPLSWDHLASEVHKASKYLTFNIMYEGIPVTNTKDLVYVYLNNRSDELAFEIVKGVSPMADMDEGVQRMYEQMYNQFEQLRTSSVPAVDPLTLTEGRLSKHDLLKVIDSLVAKAKESLFETGKKFVEKRQEYYGSDEERYKKVVMEQMEFQEMLIITSTAETTNHFGITHQAFEESVKGLSGDEEVKAALEGMAVESIMGSGSIPSELTKEKLKEILMHSCDFVHQYATAHPNIHPMDILVLKSREADEVYKQYGYDEFQVSAAMTQYAIETDPFFEEVRNKLNEVTVKLFGFNPADLGK